MYIKRSSGMILIDTATLSQCTHCAKFIWSKEPCGWLWTMCQACGAHTINRTMRQACGIHAIEKWHEARQLKEPHPPPFTHASYYHVAHHSLYCCWHLLGWGNHFINTSLSHKNAHATITWPWNVDNASVKFDVPVEFDRKRIYASLSTMCAPYIFNRRLQDMAVLE